MELRSRGVTGGRLRRFAALLALAAFTLTILLILASLHLTLNRTPSMPLGFYRTRPADRAPRRGDLVAVCLPVALAQFASQRGYLPPGPCAANTAPLLKHVAAVSGDVVDVTADGVRVNGSRLPGSALRARDEAGRTMPHAAFRRYLLRRGDIWLWTASPRGWDSRYYGALPARNVRAFAQPLLVW